ncbi:30S ribosomal protein S16 [Candidatus Falkowbacteria bacterium]|jgi:small subunit ribosomal protein S16|nr:30S ribosomal protein S16 [Candidatus Falkowbacteria bacterium]MBT7007114.1 30S ribosomal protein S16 [Candidatus Falkowbacteria bacterium]
MLSIKLARVGRKNDPFFRLIVLDKKKDTYGAFLENVGTYNPKTKELKINKESIQEWLSKGAQPTKSVHNILISQGVIEGKKVGVSRISKKRKTKLDEKAGKKEETKEAPAEAKKDEAAPTETEPAKDAPVEAPKETEKKEETQKEEAKPTEEAK